MPLAFESGWTPLTLGLATLGQLSETRHTPSPS
jgi:hypothetical protein